MNAEEFRAALDALGLKQTGPEGADTFLGVGHATIRRWAKGNARNAAGGIPHNIALLLATMIARGIKPARVVAYHQAQSWEPPTRAKEPEDAT